MTINIRFLGASGTVTGSKYLVQSKNRTLLVDAGMFQGEKTWREENWAPLDFDLERVDAVLLTHAHIDHTGILPRYRAHGLKCPVYCTRATHQLSKLVLPDAGRLQEEESNFRQKHRRSRHSPVLPLYREADAHDALELFKPVDFDRKHEILPGIEAEWRRMGHIIGAGSISLSLDGRSITFSGDIGRYDVPILKDPVPVDFGELLLIESTYGTMDHAERDTESELADVINRTIDRGGCVIIPSFAVGRTQSLLYYLRLLKVARRIPNVPVIIDSPMATDATYIYSQNTQDYDEEALAIVAQGKRPFSPDKLAFTKDRSESIRLNSVRDPMILISASGMLSGGRILHHLAHRITDPRNTVLFVGHQPRGGLGERLMRGDSPVRIMQEQVVPQAEMAAISGLSAHAGKGELLRWCRECKGRPDKVAVVHGEQDVAQSFAASLEQAFGWHSFVPHYRQELSL